MPRWNPPGDGVAMELSPDAMLCPRCAKNIVVPGTVAGDKYGVCEACHLRAMRDAKRRELSRLEAKAEYDTARKAEHRLRGTGKGRRRDAPLW